MNNRRGDTAPEKEAPEPTPSRWEEARRVMEEYVNELREMVEKLRRLLD